MRTGLSSFRWTLGVFSHLALSQGLAFFHAGCRHRWALRLAKHRVTVTTRKYNIQMHLCSTWHLLLCFAAGQEGLLARPFIQQSSIKLSIKPLHFSKLLQPENRDFALGRLTWPGAVYRNGLLFAPRMPHKQGDVYQNISLLKHIFKMLTLRVKTDKHLALDTATTLATTL